MRRLIAPDLIIRPSGVWNSRAPFHNWLLLYKHLNRAYELAILSTDHLSLDFESLSKDDQSLTKYFLKPGTARSSKAWKGYRGAWGKTPDGKLRTPTLEEVNLDLHEIRVAVRRGTLIGLYTGFEAFLNCWLLNYLLAKLERNHPWTQAERELATRLSPVHGKGMALHVPQILSDQACRTWHKPSAPCRMYSKTQSPAPFSRLLRIPP